MAPIEAKKIIQALADGIDPATGEVPVDASPLNNPSVIRALHSAVEALNAQPAPGTPRKVFAEPESAGSPWSTEEDQRLLDGFDRGATVADLAIAHKRTKGAISSRLARHGRISPARIGPQSPALGA